jgi:hypothetical protein
MAQDVVPAAEFQALPLDFIIAAPLTAVVKAQAITAAATRDFIKTFFNPEGAPDVVQFTFTQTEGNTERKVDIKAPLLAMVPVPHLRVDSLTVHFQYEITQTERDTSGTDKSLSLEAGTSGLLSKWVQASFKGGVTSRSSHESTQNRSGQLDITVHASEAPMPEGLRRVLELLSTAVPLPASQRNPPLIANPNANGNPP